MDMRIRKYAELIVNYSSGVKSGDKVMINGSVLAIPLIKEILASVLKVGGFPLIMLNFPEMEEVTYRYASEEQLKHIPPPVLMGVETYDVMINIVGTDNTKALSNVDPAKTVIRNQGRKELMDIFLKRAAEGQLRWTLALFPTNAYAQDAEMSLEEYEDFVYGACMPDESDPVGYWQRFSKWQKNLAEWLSKKRKFSIRGPDTDLTVQTDNRVFISCDGHHNMPDGEVFTGPVENGVEGFVRFSYPAIYQGREVSGVELVFKEGKVVEARAEKNREFLLHILKTDDGASYVGEFAIGTNEGIKRFTRQILFDEKIGGTFHLALGAGYPETGSKNVSSIHWDFICDLRNGGEIWADDELIYKDGKFLGGLAE